MQIESFDQAHRGRCPSCGIVDGGNHIVHRFGNDFAWSCFRHGCDGKMKVGSRDTIYRPTMVPCEPDPTCKTCIASLKRVAKFHAALRKVA